MDRLENKVQAYAWGSHTAIATLQRRPSPSVGPEAELWMGVHPLAPSRIQGTDLTLADRIAADPAATLGERTLREHGRALPFLLKVLAADQPLSLQAHPNLTQAREGFAREESAGVPRDASHRSYKDANHKPELICALTPFDALCGFRSARELHALFTALAVPALDHARTLLEGADGLRAVFEYLFALDLESRRALVESVAVHAARITVGPFEESFAWTRRFVELYPGDIGVVVALMLRYVQLAPGESLYLPAGNMHAYLHGVGVEIMASSDNVLRGGLTPKHVDVPELLHVLDFGEEPLPVVRAHAHGAVSVYETPAREFELSRIVVDREPVMLDADGPEIVLCTEGEITAGLEKLARGESVFVPASTGVYELRGAGTAFRARVPH